MQSKPQYRPLAVLDKCNGSKVWVILRGAQKLEGILKGFDADLNLVLDEAHEEVNGVYEPVGEMLLNGSGILMVVPGGRPEEDD